MQVHTNIDQLPSFTNAVVTIGTFDGVHSGHQQIIAQLKNEAVRVQGETVLITFHPHPRRIVSNQHTTPVYLLTTPEEKAELLSALGIDHMVVVPFTSDFANLTATEYIESFLWKRFQPHTLIIGYDHKFGKGRAGDYHLMEEYASRLGFRLIEIPEHVLNEVTVSSTRIRQSLLSGEVEKANTLLGYPYFFEGTIIEGNKLGRTIGYPTANLAMNNAEKLVPGNGVYAVTASFPEMPDYGVLKGMMNIGIRPTVQGTHRVIEVNLFDFDEEVYGKILKVQVHAFMRQEQKFNRLDALKAQLASDKQEAVKRLDGLA